MERNGIEKQFTWDTTSIFPSDEDWEKELKFVKGNYHFDSFKGKLGERDSLLAFLHLQDEFGRRGEKLYLYASMKHDQDVRVSKYNGYLSQINDVFTSFYSEVSYYSPEMLSLDEKYFQKIIQDPEFSSYEYALKQLLNQKKHVLTENEENMLSLSLDVMGGFRNVFSMIDNADISFGSVMYQGKRVKLTHGVYGVIMRSGNREERKATFQKYYKGYKNLLNTITAAYIGNIKKDNYIRTVRKYDSCLSMALDGEDVTPSVYTNLISAVEGGLPVLHKYISLRKRILGLDKQYMYDIYTPLVDNAEIKLSYPEAYSLVIKGLAPLGKDYQNLLQRAYDERWIDVYETEGKRSGAYSTGVYDTHPFVLLNYQSTTNDVFTIAHEMGHSIHTYKSNQTQPYAKSEYTIFLAEIASTVNEVLLLKYLLANTKDVNLQKYLLNYYIEMFRTTLFRQTQFAQFEFLSHEAAEKGEPLTKDLFNDIYYGLNQKYYGEDIIHDKEIAYEWARIPHFYSSFYVYKYSTGITAAVSIAKRILTEGQSAVNDYFTFLSSGGKCCPVDILKGVGVDLTSPKPYQTAIEEFEQTVNALEKLF